MHICILENLKLLSLSSAFVLCYFVILNNIHILLGNRSKSIFRYNSSPRFLEIIKSSRYIYKIISFYYFFLILEDNVIVKYQDIFF